MRFLLVKISGSAPPAFNPLLYPMLFLLVKIWGSAPNFLLPIFGVAEELVAQRHFSDHQADEPVEETAFPHVRAPAAVRRAPERLPQRHLPALARPFLRLARALGVHFG